MAIGLLVHSACMHEKRFDPRKIYVFNEVHEIYTPTNLSNEMLAKDKNCSIL